MIIEPIVFIGFIVTIFILGVLSIVLTSLYLKTINKIQKIEKQNSKIQEKIDERAEKALEIAREKAVRIIEEATEKTEEILSKTDDFNAESKDILMDKLSESAKKQSEALTDATNLLLLEYKSELGKLKEENINLAKTVSKGIERDILSEIKDFKNIMRKETIESQKIVGEKIEEEYSQAKKEIAEYRAEELKKVDEQIEKILASVSSSVLGEGIALEKQEELVMEALARAKAEIIKN